MYVRMKQKIGGFRNGEAWPDKGAVVEVPDHEGRDLILAGYAEDTAHGPVATIAEPVEDDEPPAPAGDDETPAAEDGDPGDAEPQGDHAVEDDEPPAPEVKELRTPAKRAPVKRAAKRAKPTDG